MAEVVTLAVLAGTVRPARESIKAARWVAAQARQLPGVEVVFVDPADFNFPGDGNGPEGKDPRYTAIVERADAFFIVTPEYNHSFPGSLKRMLDSEYDLYRHKPVALAGCSNGPWGGVRACEALLSVCHRLGLTIVQPELYFPFVQDKFDQAGNILETYRAEYEKNAAKQLGELLWMARLFKAGREARAN